MRQPTVTEIKKAAIREANFLAHYVRRTQLRGPYLVGNRENVPIALVVDYIYRRHPDIEVEPITELDRTKYKLSRKKRSR